MQGKSWYFSRKGRVEGPFSLEQLKQRIKLNDDYMIWSPKLAQWVKAEQIFRKTASSESSLANKVNQPTSINGEFIRKWKALEKKQADERQQLIHEIMAKQQHYGRLMEKARNSDNSSSFKPAHNKKSVSKKTIDKAAAKTQSHGGSQPPSNTSSLRSINRQMLSETKHKPMAWSTSKQSQQEKAKAPIKSDKVQSAKNDFLWPLNTETNDPEINQKDLEIEPVPTKKPADLKTEGQVILAPEKKDDEHQAMLRRVNRRRRRRAR